MSAPGSTDETAADVLVAALQQRGVVLRAESGELLQLSARTALDVAHIQPSQPSHSSHATASPEEAPAATAQNRGTVSESWDGYEHPMSAENGHEQPTSPLVDDGAGPDGTDGTVSAAYNGQGVGAGESDEIEEFRI
jgi:hypothetical protein